MKTIKTKHTDRMVYDLWSGMDDYIQDHIKHQLHDNIQHPLWSQMCDQMSDQICGQIQRRVQDYIDVNYEMPSY